MKIMKKARSVARSVLGPRLSELVQRPFQARLASIGQYRAQLMARRGLEIGGPSPVLADSGAIPVYGALRSLDNCLYSRNTIWAGAVEEGNTFFWQSGKEPGRQILCDATDLSPVEASSYECILACHCLEHIANPLRALAEWKRVLEKDGLLLLVLPHKDGTFDWRRPTTRLSHLIEDFEKNVDEGDLSHLEEILELHDLSKDIPAGTKEQFRERCLENIVHRAMHHHVFDTMGALQVVDHMGFEILLVDDMLPFHILILGRKIGRRIDNAAIMGSEAQHWRRSPFPSDREVSRGQTK